MAPWQSSTDKNDEETTFEIEAKTAGGFNIFFAPSFSVCNDKSI